MQVNQHTKIINLDIKDLYVNLPIQGILQTTKFWLNKHNNTNAIIEQSLHLLKIILKQNYFQYNSQLFQPEKGIAVGTPISSTIAEICLQFLEEIYIKQWLERKEIIYYKRCVDDQNRRNKQAIINHVNNIDKHLQFKISGEENNFVTTLTSPSTETTITSIQESTQNPHAPILPYNSPLTIHLNIN
jgi:hypothetical protein